jgi:hypothetical protein
MKKTYRGSCHCGAVRFECEIEHSFCGLCGVKTFGRGRMDDFGDFYAVSVAALDNASIAELAEAPVRYEDGRHDDWGSLLPETRHL